MIVSNTHAHSELLQIQVSYTQKIVGVIAKYLSFACKCHKPQGFDAFLNFQAKLLKLLKRHLRLILTFQFVSK